MSAVKTSLEKTEIERIEEAELVRDEPQDRFQFDEENHVYTLDDKRMWGTTTILSVIAKPALINWSAGMAVDYIDGFVREVAEHADWTAMFESKKWDEITKEARVAHTKRKESAGEAGTLVHAELEKLIKVAIQLDGRIEEYMVRDDMSPQAKEFVQWAIVNKVKFLDSEKRLYSEKLWVAGTADFICTIKNKLYIGDIKTSSAIYPEHFIQASAYAHMARQMGLYQKFHGVIIVNIPKRGGLKVKENYDLKGNFEAFKGALVLHKFQQAQKIKK